MQKFIKLVLAASIVVGFSSCLKDKNYDEDKTGHNLDGVPKVIEIGYANDPNHSKAVALDFEDKIVPVELFRARLAATDVAPEDITVTVDTTGARDTIVRRGYTPLPASFFTYDQTNFKVVIPKGSREVPFTIKTNAINYNPSVTYALYVRLKAVDKSGYNVSGNFNEFLVTFGAKNKYDGVYEVTGTFSHAVNAAFTGNYPREYYLITTGASSVDVAQVINGAIVPGYLFLNAGAGTFFGSFGITMTFNPSTDAITELHNYYGDPSKAANAVGNPAASTGAPLYASNANGRRATLDPSGVNAYSNGVIKMKYFMYQPSVVASAPAAFFNEVLTYVRPR